MRNAQRAGGRTFVIRLEKGDDVVGGILDACSEHEIRSGLVFGIGALGKCTLYASRSADRLEPAELSLEEPLEIASASGNITQKDGKNHLHLHVVLGRKDCTSVAGHLKSGVVSLTGEFFLLEADPLQRKRNEKLGLDLLGI